MPAPVKGYFTIDRTWNQSDEIQLELPHTTRFINAGTAVKVLNSQVAIASGPLVAPSHTKFGSKTLFGCNTG